MADDLAVLQETVAVLDARLRPLLGGADDGDDGAADLLDALAAALADLNQQVQESADAALESSERALSQLAAWQTAATAEVDDTVQALDGLIERIDEFADGLRDEAGQFSDACGDASGEVADASAEFADKLGEAAQGVLLTPLTEAFEGRVAEVDALQRQAIDACADRLDEAAAELQSLLLAALADARETLSAAIRQSEGERAATQPLLDAVQVVLDPLLEQVERVTGLAEAVGISV